MTEERGRKSILIKNPELSELVIRLNEMKNSEGVLVVSQLLRLMLQETRELNDNVSPDDFKFNQGIISVIKTFIGYIENGTSMDKFNI